MNSFGELIASNWKLEVLEELEERPNYQFTIRELAKKTSGSYGSVREFVHALNEWGLVSIVSKGGSLLVSYKQDNKYHKLVQMLLKTESDYLREEAESYVGELVESFPEVRKVVLYGSVARKEAGKNSDIDLLVLTNSDLEEDIRKHSHKYSDKVTISPVVESVEEYQKNIEKNQEFEQQVKKEGIVLFSNEN